MKKFFVGLLWIIIILIIIISSILIYKTIIENVNINVASYKNVYVKSEFAPLKRVILSQSEAFSINNEQSLSLEKQQSFENERNNLKSLLEKYNIEVLQTRALTKNEINLSTSNYNFATNFFARDPVFIIGNHVIEGAMKNEYRQIELLALRDIIRDEAYNNDCYYVSIPQTYGLIPTDDETGPFLEGGDILVYNNTVFVGNSGLATNEAGIKWLQNYLGRFGYNVVEIKLNQVVKHLDCAISLVKDNLLIVCEDALKDGLPKELEDWNKIKVSVEEAQRIAVNGLPINEKVYITDIEFKNTIGAELEKRGIEVEYLDFSVTRSFKRSF